MEPLELTFPGTYRGGYPPPQQTAFPQYAYVQPRAVPPQESGAKKGIGITLIVVGSVAACAGAVIAWAYFSSSFAETIGAASVHGTLAGRVAMVGCIGGGLGALVLGIILVKNSSKKEQQRETPSLYHPYDPFYFGERIPAIDYRHEPLVYPNEGEGAQNLGGGWEQTFSAAVPSQSPTADFVEKAQSCPHEALRRHFDTFTAQLRSYVEGDNLRELPCFSQFLHNIRTIPGNEELHARCLEWAISMLLVWQPSAGQRGIPRYVLIDSCMILKNNWAEENLKNEINARAHNLRTLPAPADGNCMLWSCIFGQKLIQSRDPQATLDSLRCLSRVRPGTAYFPQAAQLELNGFRHRLREVFLQFFNDEVFKRQFLVNLQTAPRDVFSRIVVGQDAGNFDAIYASGQPTVAMRDNYANLLITNKEWNGEFEAYLAAYVLQRPIVIIQWHGPTKRYVTELVAGMQFLDRADGQIIYIRHLGNLGAHYDCVVPDSLK